MSKKTKDASLETTTRKNSLIEFMQTMLLIRRFEEKISAFAVKKTLPGWLHLSIGQEAISVGMCACLSNEDWIVSGHRAHGDAIAKGLPLEKLAAELFGKATGCCKGMAGSMHLIDSTKHLLCTSFVGSGLPIASGLGMSLKSKSSSGVVVAFSGDGASNTGAFHESLNLSAVWRLPVVFVIVNNQYAISTRVPASTAVDHISKRAQSYGIPGTTIDGNDVENVYETAAGLIRRAREGFGPSLIECLTYRLHGHYEGEQWEVYRSEEEVKEWVNKDPILRLKATLKTLGMSDSEFGSLDKDAEAQVNKAVEFAMNSPNPNPGELSSYVFS